MPGTLALVGGEEFTDGCTFDAGLVAGAQSVLLVPTGRAYENPGGVVEHARDWFGRLGVQTVALEVYRRAQAGDDTAIRRVAEAEVIYVTGGSPMHLRSVMKDTPLLDAIVAAWDSGTTVVLAGEACAVACTDMFDSRGGAITVGLGVISAFTVVPKLNRWSPEMWHRTIGLARRDIPILGIDEATAAIRSADGEWHAEGAGSVHVHLGGAAADLSVLP